MKEISKNRMLPDAGARPSYVLHFAVIRTRSKHSPRPALIRAGRILLVCIAALYSGCAFFRMESISVTAWTPESEYVEAIDCCTVSLTFSAGMNKVTAEEAFTLTSGGDEVRGRYFWEGRTMTFTPFAPLDRAAEYIMKLTQTAEDEYGNNMRTDFLHIFSAVQERARPQLLGFWPEDRSLIPDTHQAVTLQFSRKMDRASLYENFSLSPDPGGTFTWNRDDTACTFTPNKGMTRGEEYTVTLGAGVSDSDGNTFGAEHRFSFTIASDREAPSIVSVSSDEQTTFILAEDDPGDSIMTVTGGWECSWNLRITFSEEMDAADLETCIDTEPGTDFRVEAVTGRIYRILFNERTAYDTLYSLILDDEISDTSGNSLGTARTYRFRTNGPGSLPPSIQLVRFSGNTGSAGATVTLQPYNNLSLNSGQGATDEYFDLYFRTAQGAGILKKSFIENFSISSSNTAGCFCISLFGVELSPAAPDPAPGTDEQVVRVYASMETFTDPGIMTLNMEKGFTDSLGNGIDGEWTMQVNVINN